MVLELILQLMPVLIQLINKNATDRSEAIEYGRVIQKAAMQTGSWEGIFLGGLIQRIGKMTDDQQATVIEAMESAVAAHQARQAKGE